MTLELKAGEPGFYDVLVACIFLLLLVALITSPLAAAYTVTILITSFLILAYDRWSRQNRSRYSGLRVDLNHVISLVDDQGRERPATVSGSCWVTGCLILVPIRLHCGKRLDIMISRDRNRADAYRRFTVIARHAFAANGSERHNESPPDLAKQRTKGV